MKNVIPVIISWPGTNHLWTSTSRKPQTSVYLTVKPKALPLTILLRKTIIINRSGHLDPMWSSVRSAAKGRVGCSPRTMSSHTTTTATDVSNRWLTKTPPHGGATCYEGYAGQRRAMHRRASDELWTRTMATIRGDETRSVTLSLCLCLPFHMSVSIFLCPSLSAFVSVCLSVSPFVSLIIHF